MGVTLATTLASIQQGVWTDLFFKGLTEKPILTNLAEVHDLRGALSTTVNFPQVGAIAATKLGDGVTTTYTSIAPTDATATAYEIQSAVQVTRFAQSTTPIKSAEKMVASLMAALANQAETDLLAEAATATDSISTNAVALSLAVIRTARAVLGGYQEQLGGWVLNPTGENALIADANLSQATQYGSAAVIQDGRIGNLYGAPVFVTPFLAATKSVMVGKGTCHLGVVEAPTYDVVYDPDTRSDKVVARSIIAVKYLATDVSKGALINHT